MDPGQGFDHAWLSLEPVSPLIECLHPHSTFGVTLFCTDYKLSRDRYQVAEIQTAILQELQPMR